MRRLVLTTAVSLTALGLGGSSFAEDRRIETGTHTVSTPGSAPVGVTVTVEPLIVTAPEDPLMGGTITAGGGAVTVQPRGVPDPLAPAPDEADEDEDKDKDKDKDAGR